MSDISDIISNSNDLNSDEEIDFEGDDLEKYQITDEDSKPYQLAISIDSANIVPLRMQIENNISVLVEFGINLGKTKICKANFTPEW